MIVAHTEDCNFCPMSAGTELLCTRKNFVDPRTGVHTGGGVHVESAETGAEKEKGAAQRSPIPPGRENVAAVETGQLSSNYTQFPCHSPATVSNRYSGTLNLY